jgi:hypothetical protein
VRVHMLRVHTYGFKRAPGILLTALLSVSCGANRPPVESPEGQAACAAARRALGALLRGPHSCSQASDCSATGLDQGFQPAPSDWRIRHPKEYEAFRSSCPRSLLMRWESPPAVTATCASETCIVVMRK